MWYIANFNSLQLSTGTWRAFCMLNGSMNVWSYFIGNFFSQQVHSNWLFPTSTGSQLSVPLCFPFSSLPSTVDFCLYCRANDQMPDSADSGASILYSCWPFSASVKSLMPLPWFSFRLDGSFFCSVYPPTNGSALMGLDPGLAFPYTDTEVFLW